MWLYWFHHDYNKQRWIYTQKNAWVKYIFLYSDKFNQQYKLRLYQVTKSHYNCGFSVIIFAIFEFGIWAHWSTSFCSQIFIHCNDIHRQSFQKCKCMDVDKQCLLIQVWKIKEPIMRKTICNFWEKTTNLLKRNNLGASYNYGSSQIPMVWPTLAFCLQYIWSNVDKWRWCDVPLLIGPTWYWQRLVRCWPNVFNHTSSAYDNMMPFTALGRRCSDLIYGYKLFLIR